MRNQTFLITCILFFAFTACRNNQSNSADDGYCSELDTMYKRNSVEIESITRTFYRKGDILNDCIQLKQTIGDSTFYLAINDQEGKVGFTTLSSNDMSKLFDNMRTVASNYGKNLSFDIGESILNGSISSGIKVNSVSLMALEASQMKPVLSMDLFQTDIDKMEAAYKRYRGE